MFEWMFEFRNSCTGIRNSKSTTKWLWRLNDIPT